MENGLTRLVEWIESAEDATLASRKSSERCRDYYDGKQLTDEEVKTLARRKQPPIVINRIKPKVNFLLGMERQGRTDPKAFPREPDHDDAADAATDAMRYVADNNDFDQLASEVGENMFIEGTGGVEVVVVPKKGDFEIQIKRYNWDRILWDQHSRERDFSDARWLGAVLWMDKEDALAEFQGKESVIDSAFEHANNDTYEDTPRNWTDGKRNRVKISYICFKEGGKWHYAWFTKAGFLKGPAASPYEDEDGLPDCPLIFQSAYVDRDGFRYGPVRDWLDIQDEINKRRSKALHHSNSRQTFSNRGSMGEDVDELKRELSKPDGHLTFEHGEWGKDFGVVPTSDLEMAQFNLLQESKNEIDAVGVNSALSGTEERSMSGRAIQARQQGGAMELGPLFDAHRHWKRRVYRAIWNRVKQYWNKEKWIRVTDDENNLQWVGLNQPVTLKDQLEEQHGQIPPQMMGDPRLEQVVEVQNNVAEMDVDIIIDQSPDVVTLQQESFEMLMNAVSASQQPVPLPTLIKLMPGFPNKQKVLDELDGDEQAKQANAQAQQQAQQMQQAMVEAELGEKQAKATKDMAQAQKYQVEAAMAVQPTPYV